MYDAIARIPAAGPPGETIVGRKATGLDVYFPDDEVLHYDLQGRLVRIARPPEQWRRGLSGRVLLLRKRTREQGGGLAREHVDPGNAEALVDAAHARLQPIQSVLAAGTAAVEARTPSAASAATDLGEVVRRAAAFDVQAARDDIACFRNVYGEVPILPPDQYNSLVLLATEGCRFNTCTFCNFYRGTAYRARSLDEFRHHVEQAVRYHGKGLTMRRGIFLGQANALLGPRRWREELLRFLCQRFELPDARQHRCSPSWWQGHVTRFAGISTFLDALSGARISVEEYAAMRELNLRQVSIGLESGSAKLLAWLRKPARPDQVLETAQAARQAGVAVTVIVLVGAGGEQYFEAHVRDTVSLIRAMSLSAGDCVYLSPLLVGTSAPYAALAESAGIQPLTPARQLEQQQLLRAGIAPPPSQHGPYVSLYDVDFFMY